MWKVNMYIRSSLHSMAAHFKRLLHLFLVPLYISVPTNPMFQHHRAWFNVKLGRYQVNSIYVLNFTSFQQEYRSYEFLSNHYHLKLKVSLFWTTQLINLKCSLNFCIKYNNPQTYSIISSATIVKNKKNWMFLMVAAIFKRYRGSLTMTLTKLTFLLEISTYECVPNCI